MNTVWDDIFVWDRDTGALSFVSVSSSGEEADGASFDPAISSDGRYVTFSSLATNLVPGAGADGLSQQIYVRDRDTDGDGLFDEPDAVRTELLSRTSKGVLGNGSSFVPAISETGRFVSFTSSATNLVAKDINTGDDIFIRDRDADGDGIFDETDGVRTVRVSVNHMNRQVKYANAGFADLSASGRFVAFQSTGALVRDDLNGRIDIYLRDRDTDKDGIFDEADAARTTRVSLTRKNVESCCADSRYPSISSDGHHVAFTVGEPFFGLNQDSNYADDVAVRDVIRQKTFRVSLSTSGAESLKSEDSRASDISGNGRFVVFQSEATNFSPLADGDTYTSATFDIFIRDRDTDQDNKFDEAGFVSTDLISVGADGSANDQSEHPTISDDGYFIAFQSLATNLGPPDVDTYYDVYVTRFTSQD